MHFIDWLIVGVYAAISLATGMLASHRVKSMSDYLAADRSVGLHLGVASLTGTELGIVTVMALAEFGYLHGFSAFGFGLCFFTGVTFVGATGFIIKRLRQRMVLTIPEFYEQRYSRGVRLVGGFVLAFAGILNMGIFLKLGATFFTHIGGFDPQSVPWIMGGLLALVLSFTLVGGMVAVVFVDYFQFLFLMTAMLVATLFAIRATGFSQMFNVVSENFGAKGFNPLLPEDMNWPFFLVNTLVFICVPTLWQPAASRALSAENPEIAQKTILISGLTFMGRGTLPILWGIAALCYFQMPGHTPGAELKAMDAMPRFLSEVLPVGVLGLFVAGMFAADISTYNAYLLAWSGVVTQDVIAPLFGGTLNDRTRVFLNRVLIVLIGVFLIWWGLIYTPPSNFIQYQHATGTCYFSGALACVVLGLYWKGANSAGAYAAILTGAIVPLVNVLLATNYRNQLPSWLEFLKNDWLPSVAAFGIAMAAMIIVSLLTNSLAPRNQGEKA